MAARKSDSHAVRSIGIRWRWFRVLPEDMVVLAEATFGRLGEDECRALVSADGCP